MDSPTCFVIMPFGDRVDHDGQVVDFDGVLQRIIKPAVERLKMKFRCVRCDEIGGPGWIHRDMMEHVHGAELAIVDITTGNPNVFYELGVRHALRRGVTVLIRRRGTTSPFNVLPMRCVDYDLTDEGERKARLQIAGFARIGLKRGRGDSLVHEALPNLSRTLGKPPKVLAPDDPFEYQLSGGRKICIALGSIGDAVRIADIWVNSENTSMEMARVFESSISGVIRYLGARKDEFREVVEDSIANALKKALGIRKSVAPGVVLTTPAGELQASHGVQRILHVASAQAVPPRGVTPIPGIEVCVTNVLQTAGSLRRPKPKSILFPLMGCGTSGGNVEEIAPKLLDRAITMLHAGRTGSIERVYFLAWTDQQLAVCKRAIEANPHVQSLAVRRPPPVAGSPGAPPT